MNCLIYDWIEYTFKSIKPREQWICIEIYVCYDISFGVSSFWFQEIQQWKYRFENDSLYVHNTQFDVDNRDTFENF